MVANVLKPGSSFPTPALVGDLINSYPAANGLPASGPGGTPSFTQVTVAGVLENPSIAFEIQSTTGAFLMPRMTAAQRAALIPSVGMQVYELDTEAVWWYLNDAWVQVDPSSGGGGSVDGPDVSTINAIAVYGNTLGTAIANTVTLLDPATGDLTAVGTIHAAVGSVTAPTYSFTGDTNTGIYRSAADTLDFTCGGSRQLQIEAVASAVNFISVVGAPTSGTLSVNTPLLATTGSSDAAVDIGFFTHGATSGVSLFANDAGATTALRFWNTANTFYSALKAGANVGSHTWTLPIVDGAAGTPLVTDGSGVLSFSATSLTNVVTNAGTSTDNAIARFDSTTGKIIQNSAAIVSDTSGTITLGTNGQFIADAGSITAPAFGFVGDTNCGIYHASADHIGFAANGLLQFSVTGPLSAVNYIEFSGSIATAATHFNALGTDTNISINAITKGSGTFGVASGSAANPGQINLYNNAISQHIGLTVAGALASTVNYTLPVAPVANGNVMACTTAGIMSWVTPASLLVGNGVQIATGTITAAEFNGAYAAPKVLVAAAGANTLLVPVAFGLELVYGTAQFAAGGAVSMQYDSTIHAGGTLCTATVAAATFTGAVANTIVGVWAPFLPTALNTALVNKGLYLSNATAAFTTGDSTFNYYVAYMTVTTT